MFLALHTLPRVTESRPARARPAAGLDDVLLDVKLSVPQIRPGMVESRPADRGGPDQSGTGGRDHGARRVRKVDPAVRVGPGRGPCRRVGLAGPSRRRSRASCSPSWPRRTSGCSRPGPGWWPMSAVWASRPWAAPRPVIASAFRRSPAPFVLMLDDLHELQSPACHDVLGVVISGIPPGSQLVTASRSEQPHLPRMRASGDALELRGRGPCPGTRRRRADLLDVPGPADRGPGRARHRTDRGLAGRPAAGGDDRPRHAPGRLDGLRRRPVRGRLPLPRVAEPAGPDHPAVPAPNRGARPAARPALRRVARRYGQPGPVAGARGVELVPDPARPPAGVVPIPPAVPGVPAQRAASRRARRGHEAAPARRRLVRGERLAGDGPGAPAEHQRAGPLRAAA